ncbi:MAG TPA: hypothetical protein VEK38_00290 [Candidatus Bathyarchaeia archaeon]|nr:hypothetical protein [Candidatus Bathyarchaeia archaeon]
MIFTPPLPPPPAVTIYVHGTRPSAVIPVDPFSLIASGEQAFYAYLPGLEPVEKLDTESYAYTTIEKLSQADSVQFPLEHFYSFGWSGALRNYERVAAAQELYKSITELCCHYQKIYNTLPRITIITHSHGGNVALFLGLLAEKNPVNWTISRLVLLACPVQKNTKNFVALPLFEKIYSLHSHDDFIQVLDPQGVHGTADLSLKKKLKKIVHNIVHHHLFSDRHFPAHPHLVQACITWKGGVHYCPQEIDEAHVKRIYHVFKNIDRFKKRRGLWHMEFQLQPFMEKLPDILKILDGKRETGKTAPAIYACAL